MNFAIGDRVIYVPAHARGDSSHPDIEVGTVTSRNATIVFVRFGDDTQSKGCYPRDLFHDDSPPNEYPHS
jgi:hypothetical protein